MDMKRVGTALVMILLLAGCCTKIVLTPGYDSTPRKEPEVVVKPQVYNKPAKPHRSSPHSVPTKPDTVTVSRKNLQPNASDRETGRSARADSLVAVPGVIGKSLDEADKKLKSEGFVIGQVTKDFIGEYAPGFIQSQLVVAAQIPTPERRHPKGGKVDLVMETPAPVKAMIFATILAAGGGVAAMAFKRKLPVNVSIHPDAGSQQLNAPAGLAGSYGFILRVRHDPGVQEIRFKDQNIN